MDSGGKSYPFQPIFLWLIFLALVLSGCSSPSKAPDAHSRDSTSQPTDAGDGSFDAASSADIDGYDAPDPRDATFPPLDVQFDGEGDGGAGSEGPSWAAEASLAVVPGGPTTARLEWPPAEDDGEIAVYEVFKGQQRIARLPGDTRRLKLDELEPTKTYDFAIVARDDFAQRTPEKLQTSFKFDVPAPSDVAPPVDASRINDSFDRNSFLFQGSDPIQRDVEPWAVKPERISLLQGRVLDRDGNPISGVRIAVHDHSELGYTLTRPDGRWNLAVNGGGRVTVEFARMGYISVQRSVELQWKEPAAIGEVVLTKQAKTASSVDLSKGLQVARSEVRKDSDGKRRVTLIFQPGTKAEMVLPDGSTKPLQAFDVRVKEFTVGSTGQNAMPAGLPPTSAYTFAAEVSVDQAEQAGAERVEFSEPVAMYVDNFLDVPVGMTVPLGLYDRGDANWVPENSGFVLAVVGTDSQGRAEIDVDADGKADPSKLLSKLGMTDGERTRIAKSFSKGDELWRVPMPHFSTPDLNYSPRCDPAKSDCSPPRVRAKKSSKKEEPCSNQTGGSTIECESQVLRETAPIAGVPFSLNYSSRLQFGYAAKRQYVYKVWDEKPEGLNGTYGIRTIGNKGTSISPKNGTLSFTWDGTVNRAGRRAQGSVHGSIKLYFCYPATCGGGNFGSPSSGGSSLTALISSGGSNPKSRNLPSDSCRNPFCIPTEISLDLHGWSLPRKSMGGWTVSVHHRYDAAVQRLYRGNGTVRDLGREVSTLRVASVAGKKGGFPRKIVPGSSAHGVAFGEPRGLDVASDGTIYVADAGRDQVLAIRPEGGVEIVAGTKQGVGFSGDGGPAIYAELRDPADVAVGPDGSIYIADSHNHRIRRVSPSGLIDTIAGSGAAGKDHGGFSGDEGPARKSRLNTPTGLAVEPGGSLYVADTMNHRIRRITVPDAQGERTITTIAGSWYVDPYGDKGGAFRGDGGPAVDAKMDQPTGIDVDGAGNIYVVDSENHRIRRIQPGGTIDTIVGDGSEPSAERTRDGIATQVGLSESASISVAENGAVFIGESGQIRRLVSGRLTEYVGHPEGAGRGTAGKRAKKTKVGRASVRGLAMTPDGRLIYSDSDNEQLRRVEAPSPELQGASTLVPSTDGQLIYAFDSGGRHQKTLAADTGAVLFEFGYSKEGWLIAVRDRNGRTTTIKRDKKGRPIGIVSPDGVQTRLDLYSGGKNDGLLKKVTGPTGVSRSFDYYRAGTDPGCLKDGSNCEGLLKTYTDPGGGVHNFEYDKLGRLIKDTGPEGFEKTLKRNKLGKGKDGYRVTWTSGGSESRTYTNRFPEDRSASWRKKRSVEVAPGQKLKMTVHDDGTRTTVLPDGTKITDDVGGDPRFGMLAPTTGSRTVETPSGLKATIKVERDAKLENEDEPTSLKTLTTKTAINGATWRRQYGKVGKMGVKRRVVATSPTGRKGTVEYDDRGRVIRQTVPGLHPVRYRYGPKGRLTAIEQGPKGGPTRVTKLGYDGKGYLKKATAPDGHSTSFTRDGAGRPLHQLLPATKMGAPARSHRIDFGYDSAGRLQSLAPPARSKHSFSYDKAGRPKRYAPPSGGQGKLAVEYGYDQDGRLMSIKSPEGDLTRIHWQTQSGRLDKIVHSGGRSIDYRYGAGTGRLSKIIEAESGQTSSIAFTRDGPLVTAMRWSEGGKTVGSVEMNYSNSLRLRSRSVNGGHAVAFGYDRDGFRTTVGSMGLDFHDKNGLLETSKLKSFRTQWAWSRFGQPKSRRVTAAGGFRFDVSYQYDAMGRITRLTETDGQQTRRIKYVYDARGRLVEVYRDKDGDQSFAASERTHSYEWGPNGNPLAVERPSGKISASQLMVDGQDRLRQFGRWRFQYTTSGEVRSRKATMTGGTTTYGWGEFGTLERVDLAGGKTVAYESDPLLRRVVRRLKDKQGQTTDFRRYVYKDVRNPVATLDRNGKVVSRFVYGESSYVPSYMIRSGRTYRFVVDHLGSVRAVVDAQTGQVKQRIDYGPYGQVLRDTNPGFQPFGFAGGLYDPVTGLVHFGSREYDPRIGRFLKKDGIGFAGGDLNLYGYVSRDPVNFIDPTGHYLETAVDLASLGYNLYRLGADNVFGDCDNLGSNLTAVGMDAVGLALPAVGGLGTATRYGDEAVEAGSKITRNLDDGCFVAGTPVPTDEGAKPIESIKVGDYVLSRNPETGEENWRRVVDTTIRRELPVLRLGLGEDGAGAADTLVVTGEHPFWRRGSGWTPADELGPSDEVFTSRGGWMRVTSTTWLQDTRTVYNLEVHGFHTYFVGESGAWVHNTCILKPDTAAVGPHTVFKRDESGRVSGYITFDKNPHYPRNAGFVKKKRFRGSGREHNGFEPPYVRERPTSANPGANLGEPRTPEGWEQPGGY